MRCISPPPVCCHSFQLADMVLCLQRANRQDFQCKIFLINCNCDVCAEEHSPTQQIILTVCCLPPNWCAKAGQLLLLFWIGLRVHSVCWIVWCGFCSDSLQVWPHIQACYLRLPKFMGVLCVWFLSKYLMSYAVTDVTPTTPPQFLKLPNDSLAWD